MVRIFLISIIFISISIANIYASEPLGYAESNNMEIAKNKAINNLIKNTSTEVFSKYKRTLFNNNIENIKKSFKLFSLFTYIKKDLLTINIEKIDDVFKVTVTHPDPIKYINLINMTVDTINTKLSQIKDIDNSSNILPLQAILKDYDTYNLYSEILSTLIITDHKIPDMSYDKLINKIFAMQNNIEMIDEFIDILTAGVNSDNMLVLPVVSAVYQDESEFSQYLTSLLKDKTYKRSKYKNTLKCFYVDNKDNIIINCDYLNLDGAELSSSIVQIDKTLLDDMTYKTKSETIIDDLTDQFNNKKLQIDMRYLPVSSPLFLSNGDYFTLQIKVTMPSFVNIIAYSRSDNSTIGDSAYILKPNGYEEIYIDSKNINRYISVGRYKITKPTGVEVIEAYAREFKGDNLTLDNIFKDETLLNINLERISAIISRMILNTDGEKGKAVLAIRTDKN